MEGMHDTEHVAVRQGPAATLEVLFRAEYTGMVRLAFTIIGNEAEAEEAVQDCFVQLAGRIDDLDQPGAYLRTSVVNRCTAIIRRRRVLQQQPPPKPQDLIRDDEVLWDVLETLSGHQRTAIVLRYYGGYRASEIAKITDVPAATIRSHLRRALRTMRKELSS